MIPTVTDPALWHIATNNKRMAILATYVDDMLHAGIDSYVDLIKLN